MKLLSPTLLAIAVACFALPAAAQSAGDWTLAIGAGHVNPKSDNGSLADGTLDVDIGSSTRPTIAFEYFIRDGLGIEVLAATPFSHEIDIDGMGKVGSTKHLPPTVSLQYHFNRAGKVRPLLGLGVNYTNFFSEGSRRARIESRASSSGRPICGRKNSSSSMARTRSRSSAYAPSRIFCSSFATAGSAVTGSFAGPLPTVSGLSFLSLGLSLPLFSSVPFTATSSPGVEGRMASSVVSMAPRYRRSAIVPSTSAARASSSTGSQVPSHRSSASRSAGVTHSP